MPTLASRQYMQAHHLKDDAALQAYFTSRVQQLVAKHHKTMIGWDEVLQPNTPHDVVIQSWRGQESLAEAARRGYRGILSTGYYIDLNHSAADHYSVDPLGKGASKLSPAQQANVLGGEAAMWSEFVTPENVNGRIWPRTAAIPERLWSPQDVTDVEDMYRRLDIFSQKMIYYGLTYRAGSEQMLERLSGYSNGAALRVLASAVQPSRDYFRVNTKKYDAFTPLNRLVDAIPPESHQAREFNEIAARIAAGKASPEDWHNARSWLARWRDNEAILQPTLARSPLTANLVSVSRNVSRTAKLGLLALDALHCGREMSGEGRQEQLAELAGFQKPTSDLVDAIVPGVEAMVRAIHTQDKK